MAIRASSSSSAAEHLPTAKRGSPPRRRPPSAPAARPVSQSGYGSAVAAQRHDSAVELEAARGRLEDVEHAQARPAVGAAGTAGADAVGELGHDTLQRLAL